MSTSAPAAPAQAQTHPLLDAFEGRIRRVWVSPFYFAALIIVAAAMVVLPLIYLAIIAATGYGLYYHATENLALITAGPRMHPKLMFFKVVVLYGGPLIIGGILIVFMIKPLFARPSRRERRLTLLREREPVLFEFVDRLCKAVGAPRPKRIDVSCEVNASASFRHGLWSIFVPGDLVLTIGAPLAAGLSVRQFAGVLAHEFGHFAQGLGMRLSYVIRAVNGWFARVVYERDSWDEWLTEERGEDDSFCFTLILLIARLFVWLTRKILWLLMIIGHVLSCGLLRQMEYDADRHETRLAGSAAFEQTSRRMHLLDFAGAAVHKEMSRTWEDGRLPDNLPVVIAARADEAPPDVLAAVQECIEKGRTRVFDSHPCTSARIRSALRENADGVFRADGPAAALFANFEGLCKSITLDYYRGELGLEITATNLISTADLTKRRKDEQRSREAAERYFCGAVTFIRPLAVDPYCAGKSSSPQETLNQLRRARASLEKAHGLIEATYGEYVSAEKTSAFAQAFVALTKAGVKLEPQKVALKSATPADVPAELTRAEQSMRGMNDRLVKIEEVLRMRIDCALALLRVPQIAARLPKAEELSRRCTTLLEALERIHNIGPGLAKARKAFPAYRSSIATLAGDFKTWAEKLHTPVMRQAAELYDVLAHVATVVEGQDYPFAHAGGRLKLRDFLFGRMPARDNPIEVMRTVERVLDRAQSLYERVMGELALIGEAVEAAAGLPRLSPAPPKQQAPESAPPGSNAN